jgi:ABC-2 type transport system permease protein
MHPRPILAIARKDAIDILINKSTLFTLLMPIFLSLLYLFLSRVVGGHVTTVVVYNPGNSKVEQAILNALSFSKVTVTRAASAGEITNTFGPAGGHKTSVYEIGLIIPADFDSSLLAGGHPEVDFYINADTIDPQTGTLVQAVVNDYARVLAVPRSPVTLKTVVINPPSQTNSGFDLGTFYIPISVLVSFLVGISLVPQLLIEEKEKKTLRMLMVTPASFGDVIAGKLLVVLIYQFILTGVVLAIQGGYTGQVPLVLLFAFLGACLSLSLGLLFGAVFQTGAAAGGVGGVVSIFYIVAGIFVGPLGKMLGNNPVIQIVKFLPTYYIADGIYNAALSQGTLKGNLVDIGVILGCTIVLLVVSTWILRRQAAVAAMI